MPTQATTVEGYLAELPEAQRDIVVALREVIQRNLPEGYVEGLQYGQIWYSVPHVRFKAGYHCDPKQPLPYLGLGATKNHVGLHLFKIYLESAAKQAFVDGWTAAGKKLDMGAACVRIKKLEDVPLDVVATAVAAFPVDRFIEVYMSLLPEERRKKVLKRLEA